MKTTRHILPGTLLLGLLGTITLTVTALAQTIGFTTQPYDPATATAASGVAGTAYSYDADAEASLSGGIKYSLRYGPNGMTVNQGTGLVSWTPSQAGTYLAEIKAELANNPSVSVNQSWAILVTECDGDAVIEGTVVDQNGDPVTRGTVTAQVVGTTRSPLTKVTADVINGEYSMTVDRATYVLRFDGDQITTKWYDNAWTFAESTPVTTVCNETRSADFQVYDYSNPSSGPKDITIFGRVVDSRTSLPVKHWPAGLSRVEGHAIPLRVWESTDEQWRLHFAPAPGQVDFTATVEGPYAGENSSSLYEVKERLSESSVVFIDAGHVYGNDGWEDVYSRQFYDFAPNFFEASPIRIESDTVLRDINFFVHMPIYSEPANSRNDTSFSRILYYTHSNVKRDPLNIINSGLKGRVMGSFYALPDPASARTRVDITRSVAAFRRDSTEWLPVTVGAGRYLGFFIPEDTNFVPGFYVKGDSASLTPYGATVLDTDSAIGTIHIIFRRRAHSSGTSDIRGNIEGITNGTREKGHAPQAIRPLTGAFIYALDSTGQVVSYTFSNDDGSYALKNLGKGTYTVHSNKMGYDLSTPQTLALSGSGEIVEASFSLTNNTPSSVPEEGTASRVRQVAATVHPNPAKDEMFIDFEGFAGTARLQVISTKGEEVMGEKVEVVNGGNRIRLDVGSLRSGSYVLTITGNEFQSTSRFTITR